MMSFHVVMFSFSPSPSYAVTTLIFRITTLTISYDSIDYYVTTLIFRITTLTISYDSIDYYVKQ